MDSLLLAIKLTLPVNDDILATVALQYEELTCAGGTLTSAATVSPKEAANLHWYLEDY